jgi:sugar lactone lactonase YvrE
MKPSPVHVVAAALFLVAAKALAQPYYWYSVAGLQGDYGSLDGTNSNARLGQPGGVAADANGNLYVADFRNNVIQKLSHLGQDWVVTTVAGSTNWNGYYLLDGTNSQARFFDPQGVAVDQGGNIYVADSFNGAIRRIRLMGTNYIVNTIANVFNWPESIAIDDATNLYVADCNHATIRKVSPAGTNWVTTTIAGMTGAAGSADGTNTDARFNLPTGIARDSLGNLYVTDVYNDTVRLITPVGTNWVVSTIAGLAGVGGTVDGTNADARFAVPEDIKIDSDGNLFVAEHSAIRKVVHSGTNWIVTTLGQNNGSFYWGEPNALAFDKFGNLFVADTYKNVIRLGQPAFALNADMSPGQLVLSWPAAASNYLLETAAALEVGTGWTPVTNGISLSADYFFWTNAITSPESYFRLHRP